MMFATLKHVLKLKKKNGSVWFYSTFWTQNSYPEKATNNPIYNSFFHGKGMCDVTWVIYSSAS